MTKSTEEIAENREQSITNSVELLLDRLNPQASTLNPETTEGSL